MISKEIAEKARRYTTLKNQVNELFEELCKFFDEEFDGCCIENFYTTAEYFGVNQGDGYCNQIMQGEDYGNGTYYYPVEDNSNEYIAVDYSFQERENNA